MFRLIWVTALMSVAIATSLTDQVKIFNITALDSSVTTLQYPWQQASECLYDQRLDVLTCVRNYPYVNVTSLWKQRPENIRYISVNCLTRGQYRRNTCVCKNASSGSKDATKQDSYLPCQLRKLDEGILGLLTNLEVLDLSFNRIETVSARALIRLRSLRYLSLTHNNIKEIPHAFFCNVPNLEYLGLSDLPLNLYPDQSLRCKANFTKLSVIDIRGANFTDVPEDALDQLPELQSLDLSFNSITEIKKKAFSGGKMLHFLDLSHCNITTVFPYFCNHLPHISHLFLHGNKFTLFDFTTIEQCSSLSDLDLSSNVITNFTGNISALVSLASINLSNNSIKSLKLTLDGLSNLSTLNLADNALESLQHDDFVGLKTLETLNLSGNSLSDSDAMETVFSDLENMRVLDLSLNQLSRISNNSFSNLNQLKQLILSKNSLEELAPLSFDGLNELDSLALDNNLLRTLPDDIFHSFIPRDKANGNETLLTRLSLSFNNLTDISNVKRWPTMVSLDISNNEITLLPSALDYSNLNHFNISHNKLESFFGKSENLAADFETLKTVDLSFNAISDIDTGKLRSMTRVAFMDMESNNIDFALTNETFDGFGSLVRLNLRNNRIRSIDNLIGKHALQNLTFLDVSQNPIEYLGTLSENYNDSFLQTINLSNCNLSYIGAETFRGLKDLENVDLRRNLIETFPLFFSNVRAKYNLNNNPLVCACNMSWLREKTVNFSENSLKIPVANYKVPKCIVYTETDLSYPYMLLRRQFMCPEVNDCDAQCACLKTEQNGSISIVKCRNNLQSIPKISSRALSIFLDGNKFGVNGSLTEFLLMSDMKAKELYLNKSSVTYLGANYFVEFEHLEILVLSFNLLTKLPSGVFRSQQMLKQLYLNDNLLTTIQINVFKNVYSLQELDLSGNNLVLLSPETASELSDLDYMKYYFLARNKWTCDCSNLGFKDLVDDVLYKIRDRKILVCNGDKSREIRYVSRSEFICEEEGSHSSKKKMIIILIVVICVLLLLVAALIYFRRELLSLLYYYTGCHIPGRTRYSGVHFDAYLTYDPSDQHCASYVHNILMPKLKNNSYNVQTSSDVIQDDEVTKKVIEDSRCSIFIVDKNFSTNSFLVRIFLIATERHKIEKRHKVIVIIHGDIDLLTLEPELNSRMRKGNYITARARLWWQRLVYELPEPCSGFRHGEDSEEDDVVVFSSLAEDQSQYEQF